MTAWQFTKHSAQENAGTMGVVGRVSAYVVLVLASMWMADTFMYDTYFANLGLFLIFSTAFELGWAGVKAEDCPLRHVRYYLYAVVVALLVVAASYLLLVANAAGEPQPPPVKASR